MPDNNITFTPHLHLSKMPSNYRVWAQLMNDNLTTVDAAVSGFILFQNLRGVWSNSTSYAGGDSVIDTTTALVWRCAVPNISSSIPMTFAQERIAFPLYWVQYSTVGAGKGIWTGPGTSYVFNDFVSDHGRYAVCILPHTSSSSFDIDLAAGKWNILIDVSVYLPLAGGVLTGPLTGTTATFSGTVETNHLTVKAPAAAVIELNDTDTAVKKFLTNDNGVFNVVNSGFSANLFSVTETGLATFTNDVYTTGRFSAGGTINASTYFNVINPVANNGFTTIGSIAQVNTGGSNKTTFIIEQNSTNVVNLEVADQANVKGTLNLQPFGGTVVAPILNSTTLNTSTLTAGLSIQRIGTDSGSVPFLISGTTKGIRATTNATETRLEGVDNTGVGSFQPLVIGGSTVQIAAPLTGTTATFTGALSAPGTPIQMVFFETGAASSGTTIIPGDDTIPQQTEGDQYLSLAITPKSSTSRLIIEVCGVWSHSVAANTIGVALFQDAGAPAIAATAFTQATLAGLCPIVLRHTMGSFSTSTTTFKVRAGGAAAGTTTFNGNAGARLYGSVMASSIMITEIT